MSEPTKTCSKCGRDLPATTEFFHRNSNGKYGLRAICRECRDQSAAALAVKANTSPPVDTVPEGFEISTITTAVDKKGEKQAQFIGARRESSLQTEVHQPLPVGHRVKGLSTYLDGEGKVRGQWIKTDIEKEQERDDLLDAIRHIADEWPERLPLPAPENCDDDTLCVYPMGDPHFGMYAWAAETGNDYDLELAEQYHVAAMEALVRESPPAKHALVIDLGDFFHMDNSSNMTPRSGHILDVDTRRPKVFRAGARSFRKLIDISQSKHENTEVWVVKGNHDEDSATPLQVALEMLYENNPRVWVNPSPAIALYKRFGNNLIGSTHTHTVKDRAGLGEIMAGERPEDWGQTKHRRWYCGHVHQDSLIETRSGVIVETMRTLAAKDKFAADHFYNSGRDMKCDIIHRVEGFKRRNIIGIEQIRRSLGMPGAV